MSTPLAVIDLGTNTFHLIIAQFKEGQLIEIYRHRVFVNLAEGGIQKISAEACSRALKAVALFQRKLEIHRVHQAKVFGTAAFRTAENGKSLMAKIRDNTGLNVELIDGLREAELIFKGTDLAFDMTGRKILIMDIGGGSVEFILGENRKMVWAKSFNIGVTVLYNRFHQTDPISPENLSELLNYLHTELSGMISHIPSTGMDALVGASGSFEVLQKMVSGKIFKSKTQNYRIDEFDRIYHKLVHSSLEERMQMPRLPKERAKLVVVAFILIDFVLKNSGVQNITVSPYALKEGALTELYNF